MRGLNLRSIASSYIEPEAGVKRPPRAQVKATRALVKKEIPVISLHLNLTDRNGNGKLRKRNSRLEKG